MPTEIECKIPVDEFTPIEAKLRKLRADPGGQFVQDDMFFDSPDQRLLQADQGLRLRSFSRQDPPGAAREHVLTYKGTRQPAQLKQREEIEVSVSDPRAMADVLERLGFVLMLHLQKQRKRYHLHDCWIELDTVPLLGRFVEVEGPSHDAIARVVGELGLDLARSITDSYASLLMAQAHRLGLPTAPARFLLAKGG